MKKTKKILNSLFKYCFDSRYRFFVNCSRLHLYDRVSDESFLKRKYNASLNKELNLDNPATYTEKLQWLKLYDRRSEYTTMVDKCAAKEYVASKIGWEYIIPTINIWENPDDIDFDALPDKFVLKCNHNSGLGMYICHDKRNMDVPSVKKGLKKGLEQDYYLTGREWPYKNVPRKILAEVYMEDSKYKELRDYKFFTFNGEPKVLYIAQGRGSSEPTVADFFDMNFNHLPFTIDHDMAPELPDKPINFDLMKKLAATLSEGTPQLRVDFYEVNGHVYFGEMTFFHCSGMECFNPVEWDRIFGDWVTLPEKRKEEQV